MYAKFQLVQKIKIEMLKAYQTFGQVLIFLGKAKLAFYKVDFSQGLKINICAKFDLIKKI